MESLILCVCLTAAIICLTATCLGGVLVWKHLQGTRIAPAEPHIDSEMPEDKSRQLYEQGFVNLMNYDGRPRRKESEMR